MFELSEMRGSFLNSFPVQRIFYTQQNSSVLDDILADIPDPSPANFLNLIEDSRREGYITEYSLDEKGRMIVSTSSNGRYFFDKSVVANILSFLGITSFLSKEVLGTTDNTYGLSASIRNGLLEVVVNTLHYFVCHVAEDRVSAITTPDKKEFRFGTTLVSPRDYKAASSLTLKMDKYSKEYGNDLKVLSYTEQIHSTASILFFVDFKEKSDRHDGVLRVSTSVGSLQEREFVGVYDRALEMSFVCPQELELQYCDLSSRLIPELNEPIDYTSILNSILYAPHDRYVHLTEQLDLHVALASSGDLSKERTFSELTDELVSLIGVEELSSSDKKAFCNLMGIILFKKLASCKKCGGTGCNC